MRESVVDWKEAGKMLCDGATFSDIAEHFGVSRQYIQTHYTQHKRGAKIKNVAYKGINDYIKESGESIGSLGTKLFGAGGGQAGYQKFHNMITGRVKSAKISDIRRIIEYTGKTFEELFEPIDKE